MAGGGYSEIAHAKVRHRRRFFAFRFVLVDATAEFHAIDYG